MPISLSHNDFIAIYYDEAWKVADIVIAATVQKNGPIHPSIDVDSVKAEGVMAGLERTFENYDPEHVSGAKVKTLLGKIVRNCVLSELGKATTEAKRACLIATPQRSQKNERRYKSLISGIRQRQNPGAPFELHEFIEYVGWQERKEEVFRQLSKYFKQLRAEDQVILNNWLHDESTYVEVSLEELGMEHTHTNANWVYGRKDKALKALKKMMGGQKPNYRDMSLQPAGPNTNSMVYSDRNELRRHQYAAKAHVTRNINYREAVTLLADKILPAVGTDTVE